MKRNSPVANVITTAFSRGLAAVALLLAFFAISRLVTPASEAGRVFLVITVSSVATPLLLFGDNSLLVRELGAHGRSAESVSLVKSVVKRFLLRNSVLAGLAAVAAFAVTDGGFATTAVALTLLLPLISLLGHALQGLSYLNTAVLAMNASFPIALCGSIVASRYLNGSTASSNTILTALFPLSALAVALGGSAILIWALRRAQAGEATAGTRSDINARDTQIFWIIHVFVAVNNWVPQLIFRAVDSDANFAFYAAAQRLANVVSFLVIVANFAFAPYVAAAVKNSDFEKLRSSYYSITRIITFLAIPPALAMLIFPSQLLSVFGSEFSQGAPILRVFAVAQLVNVATGTTNTVLNMGGKSEVLLKAMLTATVIGAVVSLATFPLLGTFAIALGGGATLVAQNLLAAQGVRRDFGIRPFSVSNFRFAPSGGIG